MSQDSYGRYTSGGGRPVDDMGSTTPGVEFSESERPGVGLLPAPYLPVGRFDEHKRANVVLSAGTPVALDGLGNLVPAGIPGGHTFAYTALDYATSLVATKLAATGVAVSTAADSIMASGLTDDVVGKFLRPIGIVSYNVFSHEGGVGGTWPAYTLTHANPVNFGIHNTMSQDLVAITCDYAIQVPYIYGRNLLGNAVKMFDNTANEVAALSATAKSYPFAHDELIPVATVATALSGSTLVVQNPVRSTGISGAINGLEIIFVSPDCGDGDSGGAATDTSAYLAFTSGATGITLTVGTGGSAGAGVAFSTLSTKGNFVLYEADTSKYVVVKNALGSAVTLTASPAIFRLTLGSQIKPGDPVVCRVGKFVKFDPTRHEADEIIGQCLRVDKSPANKDYLLNVKTAYSRSATVSHRMAGSATRGVPQLLHLVTDAAQVQYATSATLAGTALSATGMTTPPLALVVINMLR